MIASFISLPVQHYEFGPLFSIESGPDRRKKNTDDK